MSEGRGSQQGRAKNASGRGRGRGGGRGGRGKNSGSGGGRGQQNHTKQKQHHGGGRGRGRDQKQRPRSLSNQDKIREQDRARKAVEGPYAHLYCSQKHGFALSRTILRHQIEEQKNNSNESGLQKLFCPYSHKDSDNQKYRVDETWWEAVKLVRCHAPMNESDGNNDSSSFERCPICLDEDMTVPYIAPCGHSFCLPCVLGYLNAVAKELNAESERLHKSKQTQRSGVVGNTGCVPSVTVTCVRARCPMCSSGSSIELNAGDAMITYKDLRPLVFIPVMKVNTDCNMKFVKLHRSKGCSSSYLPLEGHRVRGSRSTQQQLPDLPDGDDDPEEVTYARQYFVGLEEYSSLLQRQIRELNDYRDQPVCKMDPREEWNVSMALEAVQASQRRWLDNGVVEGFISVEMSSKLEQQQHLTNCRFVQSIAATEKQHNESQVETDGKTNNKKSSLLHHGSTYLHRCEPSASSGIETDEYAYYQSCDGQLCFISGFDVACLLNEFSLHNPFQDGTIKGDRSKMPLPDEVLARVVAAEDEVLTHSLMKRKPFLSHYPLGCTVTFVELDWYSGGEGNNKPLLSQRTLKKFRDELHHRKTERIRMAKKEEKADKIARAKAEKIERQNRIDLYGANSMGSFERQTIDPDDEFFRVAMSAGETEEDVNTTPTFSFNQVCVENGVFPSLSSALASSPPKAQSSWGRNTHQSPKSPTTNFPSLSESISLTKKNVKSTSSAAEVRRWGAN